jgi:hypothetical protein
MSDVNKKASVDTTLLTAKQDSVEIISNINDSTQLASPLATTAVEKANYYVAPNGSDSNTGTIDKPFKTWQKAMSVAAAGNLCISAEVLTQLATKLEAVYVKRSGASGKRIRMWHIPRKTVLKCGGSNIAGIRLEGSYWHFKGFEITGIKQTQGRISRGFISVNSSNNIYELLNIHHNEGPGLVINNNSNNNLVLNCDFHDNYDPYNNGGNADGMSLAYIPKVYTNKIKGCRLWNNSDDGVDLWKNEGILYIDSCWAWHNGYIPGTETIAGNGQGFKFGRTDLTPDTNPNELSEIVDHSSIKQMVMIKMAVIYYGIQDNVSYKTKDTVSTYMNYH